MADKTFLIKEAFSFGWATIKKNKALIMEMFFMIVALILASWIVASSIIDNILLLENPHLFLSVASLIIIKAIIHIVTFLLMMSAVKVSLKIYDGRQVTISNVFAYLRPRKIKSAIKLIIATILFSLIVSLGFILFVIPGIYFALRYYFVTYFIVDKDMRVIEAFKYSEKITQNVKWKLLLFNIAIQLFFAISLLPMLLLLTFDWFIVSSNANLIGYLIIISGILGSIWLVVSFAMFFLTKAYIFKHLSKE